MTGVSFAEYRRRGTANGEAWSNWTDVDRANNGPYWFEPGFTHTGDINWFRDNGIPCFMFEANQKYGNPISDYFGSMSVGEYRRVNRSELSSMEMSREDYTRQEKEHEATAGVSVSGGWSAGALPGPTGSATVTGGYRYRTTSGSGSTTGNRSTNQHEVSGQVDIWETRWNSDDGYIIKPEYICKARFVNGSLVEPQPTLRFIKTISVDSRGRMGIANEELRNPVEDPRARPRPY
jgi:hypothetical protein